MDEWPFYRTGRSIDRPVPFIDRYITVKVTETDGLPEATSDRALKNMDRWPFCRTMREIPHEPEFQHEQPICAKVTETGGMPDVTSARDAKVAKTWPFFESIREIRRSDKLDPPKVIKITDSNSAVEAWPFYDFQRQLRRSDKLELTTTIKITDPDGTPGVTSAQQVEKMKVWPFWKSTRQITPRAQKLAFKAPLYVIDSDPRR